MCGNTLPPLFPNLATKLLGKAELRTPLPTIGFVRAGSLALLFFVGSESPAQCLAYSKHSRNVAKWQNRPQEQRPSSGFYWKLLSL